MKDKSIETAADKKNQSPVTPDNKHHVNHEDLPAEIPAKCQTCHAQKPHKHPYRVFISYSHQDKELAQAIIAHLRAEGVYPITDHQIRIGEAFSEAIRDMIESSHIFVPLVTENANQRLWVQQEIGYATAMHVPVCPVAVGIGNLPAGMTEQIQGIFIEGKDNKPPTFEAIMEVVSSRLNYLLIDDIIRRARKHAHQAQYTCAMHWIDRQELLVTLTETAFRQGCEMNSEKVADSMLDRSIWRLRQSAAFGSFSIQDSNVDNPDWSRRDPDRFKTLYERRLLRAERQLMEKYAACFGCDLIIDPRRYLNEFNTIFEQDISAVNALLASKDNRERVHILSSFSRTHMRIENLLKFVTSHLSDDNIRVIIPSLSHDLSNTLFIIGDWFLAEAVVPHNQTEYERTMFSRHAPTILNTIERFDQDFNDILIEHSQADSSVKKIKEKVLQQLEEWHTRLDQILALNQ